MQGDFVQPEKLAAFRRKFHNVVMVVTWIGAAALIAMVLIIFTNVIARYILRSPIAGAVEVVELILVIVAFFSVAYTELRKQHVTFDAVVFRLPRRAISIILGAMFFIGAVYAIVLGWQEVLLAISYMAPMRRVTDVFLIPIAPFMFLITIGALLWGIEMLLNALSPMTGAEQKEIKAEEGIKDEDLTR